MSSPLIHEAKINTSAVWRDALGPGYAVGAAEALLQVAGSAAARPYRVPR